MNILYKLYDLLRAIPCIFGYHVPIRYDHCKHYFCERCVRDLREVKIDGHSQFIVED